MNFELDKIIRPNIRNIKPYSSARDEYTGAASVLLDANENSFGSVGSGNKNRYPDPHQNILKQKIGEFKNIAPDNIFLGNGSDEAIDLIFRAFCVPGKDKAIIMPPTYGMYKVSADINDVGIVESPLVEGFKTDLQATLSLIGKNTKLIFICSPNNPSANCFKENEIMPILENFNGIVVVDEAYIDFADSPSWITQLEKYPNLVVLQTFSKAWGLANIRLGMAFASKEICKILDNIKPPYNINGHTQEVGLKALQNTDDYNKMLRDILKERNILETELNKLDFVQKVFPSDANFVLAKFNEPKRVYNFLVGENIIVRDRSTQHLCEGCLRITVGTKEENAVLVSALKKFNELNN